MVPDQNRSNLPAWNDPHAHLRNAMRAFFFFFDYVWKRNNNNFLFKNILK
jgi:hypothetical protein